MYGLIESIRAFLDDSNIKFCFDEVNNHIEFTRFFQNTRSTLTLCVVDVYIKDDAVCIYSSPGCCGSVNNFEELFALTEFTCRINNDVALGHFGLDVDTGLIRFFQFISLLGLDEPPKEMIEMMFYALDKIWMQYYPGFAAVMFQELSAADAYKLCKNDDNDSDER